MCFLQNLKLFITNTRDDAINQEKEPWNFQQNCGLCPENGSTLLPKMNFIRYTIWDCVLTKCYYYAIMPLVTYMVRRVCLVVCKIWHITSLCFIEFIDPVLLLTQQHKYIYSMRHLLETERHWFNLRGQGPGHIYICMHMFNTNTHAPHPLRPLPCWWSWCC